MTSNGTLGNLPTFQAAYRNANKAYKFVIHDAEKALDEVVAGSPASEFLIARYLKWCQKELNSLRSEIASGMYKNCQIYGLQEIEHSLMQLIEAFQKQEEKYKSISNQRHHNDTSQNHQNVGDEDMLADNCAHMSLG